MGPISGPPKSKCFYQVPATAMYTPFFRDGPKAGELNEKLVEYAVKKGLRGMYLTGSTGEGFLLSKEERIRVYSRAVKAARGRLQKLYTKGLIMDRKIVMLAAAAFVFASFAAEPSYSTLICHRGESVDAPENTLPAYQMAVDRGFGFECDIYLSKDGRCFTFHDSRLTRTTAGANTNRCSDVTWDEISKLDVGGWGKWKGSKFVGTRPALLEEVLSLARDGRQIYVEIKTGPEIVPYVKKVFEGQKKANPGNTLFISFNSKTCAALDKQMPEYKVYWLTGGMRYVKGRKGVPVSARELIKAVNACGANGVDILFNPAVHTKEFIDEIKAAGLEFHVWTIDDTKKTQLAFSRGVDTVTTNCAKKQLDAINASAARDR